MNRKNEAAMDPKVGEAIYTAVQSEPLARLHDMELKDLALGYSIVEMVYRPDSMDNIYGRAHGGALYALIDEAFETSCQTHGTIAVALNVNVTYVASPEPGTRLRAESREKSLTKKTATYDISVTDTDGRLIATCQALAFRTGKPIPFIAE
jgi:acyl-CoA thioesterase